MSTKFFTNSDSNTLFNKFEGIFKYTDVYYLDILVGYFYSSGYFKIRKFLNDVSEIRILVGIDLDNRTKLAVSRGLEINFNADLAREEFLKKAVKDIQDSDYSKSVEDGIKGFLDDIHTGKLKIKIHPSTQLHAKIYIFRQQEEHEHAGWGSVITGSSNLTENGLERNFEFNVELRDHDDVKFAWATFEKLWLEGINITNDFIEQIPKQTYIDTDYSPYEIYIKFLIDYFDKSIDYDPESVTDLPKGYRKLAYQVDAVNDGYAKLMKYNGFILADVVGLGKTIIAAIVAKKFYFTNGYRTKILVVHPPALKPSWTKTVRDFEIPNVDFISNGSIHKVKHPEDYDLIIIDEAHKFRSDESEMFNQLQKLCKTPRKRPGVDGNFEKKVILVTATPLNNRPSDIRNQLYLFLDSKVSNLDIGNIQHFFRPLIEKYDKLRKDRLVTKENLTKGISEIYDKIRTKVLEPLIVRRTRTDIRNSDTYWSDIVSQNLSFPEIIPPRQILYQLDDGLDSLYDKTLKLLKGGDDGLCYMRYQAIKYLPKKIKEEVYGNKADKASDSLAKIMKTLMVKRIDSSFYAFKKTLKRFLDANEAMVRMIEADRIFIAPKLSVNEFILNEDEAVLESYLEDRPDLIRAYSVEDFDEKFIKGIYHDYALSKKLHSAWDEIESDPKLDEFLRQLNLNFFDSKLNDNGKLVVFSESKETIEYLATKLRSLQSRNVLAIDSGNQSDKAETIRANFDANIPLLEKSNEYPILITTEVLAEGVNLHQANIIVNYDVPWNATRLMQRIGRVNRIGTASKNVHIFNFFPTQRTDNEIELNKKAYIKLQAFHSALGEDSQIYSNDEEFGTYGLFEKIPEEEKDERQILLEYLRKFKAEHPNEFKRIRNMPRRSRTGRRDKSRSLSTIVYLKNKLRDSFTYIKNDGSFDELTFVEAARIFRAEVSERSVERHSLHHEQVAKAVSVFEEETIVKTITVTKGIKLGPNEGLAVASINAFKNFPDITDEEKELFAFAIESIRRGVFQKLHREINTLVKEINKSAFNRAEKLEAIIKLLKKYPLKQAHEETDHEQDFSEIITEQPKPIIIISESFSA
ncbi:helicase-related protein [Mucilaginibacter lutimaris]|uniref:Helicase-related protein n=1 Tax=Mucilaginibacter lutimaris TaxID=931629 RepID=A0ABW2ZKN3_9SPHI